MKKDQPNYKVIFSQLKFVKNMHPCTIKDTKTALLGYQEILDNNLTTVNPKNPQDNNIEGIPPIVKDVKTMLEISELVHKDDGIPESQATIEVLNYFNQDSLVIQKKMNKLLEIVNYFKEAQDHFQGELNDLEKTAFGIRERQLVAEDNAEILIDSFNTDSRANLQNHDLARRGTSRKLSFIEHDRV
jgi:hypothetical protein